MPNFYDKYVTNVLKEVYAQTLGEYPGISDKGNDGYSMKRCLDEKLISVQLHTKSLHERLGI